MLSSFFSGIRLTTFLFCLNQFIKVMIVLLLMKCIVIKRFHVRKRIEIHFETSSKCLEHQIFEHLKHLNHNKWFRIKQYNAI